MSTRVRATLITAAFLVVLTLTLIGIWLLLQGRYLREEQYRRVYVVTHLIEEVSQGPLEEGNILRLARVADDTIADRSISRIMVSDRTGAVVADSDHEAYGVRPRLMARALRSEDEIVVARPDHWWGAIAVRNEAGQVLGAVMVRFPTESLVSAQRRTWIIGLVMALTGILLGSVLAYFAARIVTRPLDRLLEGIRRLQAGEAVEPIPESGGPELAEIGRAFNEMSGTVRQRVRRLELLNQLAADLSLAGNISAIAYTVRRYTMPMINAESFIWVVDPLSRVLTMVPTEEGESVGEPVSASSRSAVAVAFVERRMVVVGGEGGEMPPGSEIAPGLTAGSAIVLPLITNEGVAGVLAMVSPTGRWMGKEDIALTWAISNSVAPVVMARLRAETQSRAAATLQSLLVPAETPEMGVDLSAVYTPAEEMAGLGGDYYDLIPLGDSRWCIVVGDTSGKGLEAAQHTATAKYVIRSYVLEYGDPADALYWSNRALVLQEQAGRFITVFCGVLDPDTGALTFANAGHTLPLIYHPASGLVEYLSGQGLALGIMAEESYTDSAVRLHSGDIFCAYTDGITEARRGSEWFGDRRLSEVVVENSRRSAREICDTLLQEVRDFTGEALRDDVALVVIKMP